MRKKRDMGVSKFGVLAQIWTVGPNLNVFCNIILNVENKNYPHVRFALVVVELFQKNNQFWKVLGP